MNARTGKCADGPKAPNCCGSGVSCTASGVAVPDCCTEYWDGDSCRTVYSRQNRWNQWTFKDSFTTLDTTITDAIAETSIGDTKCAKGKSTGGGFGGVCDPDLKNNDFAWAFKHGSTAFTWCDH